MKKILIPFIFFLLISTSLLSGCTNNTSNSKIIVTLINYKDVNLNDPQFKKLSAPPNGSKFVYVSLRIKNLYDKKILTNPYYISVINETGTSFLYFKASFDLVDCFTKSYIESGSMYQGGLIFVLRDYSYATKIQYFDPLNNVNITIPINNTKNLL